MFSNMFMIGFYLYFYNKFCAEYIKTHFSKSILCVLYLIVMYKIMTIEYIIKNLIIISFIGIVGYDNKYIDNKIGYFDNNIKVMNLQKKCIEWYDKFSVYLNYVFMFYEKIVMYFKKDLLKLHAYNGDNGNEAYVNNENIEMEIMLKKMKEMLNDINTDMNNIEINNIENIKNNKKNSNNSNNSNNKLITNNKLISNNFISNSVLEDNSRIDDESKDNKIVNDIDYLQNIINNKQFKNEQIKNVLVEINRNIPKQRVTTDSGDDIENVEFLEKYLKYKKKYFDIKNM